MKAKADEGAEGVLFGFGVRSSAAEGDIGGLAGGEPERPEESSVESRLLYRLGGEVDLAGDRLGRELGMVRGCKNRLLAAVVSSTASCKACSEPIEPLVAPLNFHLILNFALTSGTK